MTDDVLVLEARDDVLEENLGTIVAEREHPVGRKCDLLAHTTQFHRSFTFPMAVNPDAINAKFENGVLKVSVPKAEQVKPRQISIG